MTATTDAPELLSVKVTMDGDTRLKVVWRSKIGEIDPYFIPQGVVEDAAKDIRLHLYSLVKDCMAKGKCANSGKILKDIAKAGYDLYQGLFLDDGKSIANVEDVQAWVTGFRNPVRINLTVDDLIHIPWGLIYDSDPDDQASPGYLTGDPEDDHIKYFQSFWCLKYKLSTTYSMVTPLSIHDPRPANLFKMLSVVNEKAFSEAMKNLEAPEDTILNWIQQSFGSPLYTSRKFFDEWKSIGREVSLLYFYCHASGTTLSLDADTNDLFNTNALKLRIKRTGAPKDLSTCVVFINGCSTATGDPKGGFLEATGSFGLCGFVGTETVVPDVFALRFGLAFLYYFLHKGFPVFQVMDILRTKHWPLSLVYSTYCYPDLQVEPIGDPNQLAIELKSNFSELALGSREM